MSGDTQINLQQHLLDQAKPQVTCPLDPDFIPAALWTRAYRKYAQAHRAAGSLCFALQQPAGAVSHYRTPLVWDDAGSREVAFRHCERILKFLLWQRGGAKVYVDGPAELVGRLQQCYAPGGERAFDHNFMGETVYGQTFTIEHVNPQQLPPVKPLHRSIGGHLDGCRVGFDLGGSDRKCAALIDGKVVHSEEIEWDPYFQQDPAYHLDGIHDSIERAVRKLPRLDAIGGSSAGVIVDNRIRVASLFRGVPPERFKEKVPDIFIELGKAWGVPLEVANDGDVTALAGAMAIQDSPVLGLSMGTSQAAGYVAAGGNLTSWLNELAFAPVDYHPAAPADEWSGDRGCGVQYFSQQAVARLAPAAGFDFSADMPLPDRLKRVQKAMAEHDARARPLFETIGVYFGYALAHYAEFYDLKHILFLGRVTSGEGGSIILEKAGEVLQTEFPRLAAEIDIRVPDEMEKRHGQAVAAASLPESQR